MGRPICAIHVIEASADSKRCVEHDVHLQKIKNNALPEKDLISAVGTKACTII